MGSLAAMDMVEQADPDTALRWHLTSNHFPPLPGDIFPVAKRVIARINAGEEWHKQVRLPEGTTWRGRRLAPLWACVDAWHLDAFLTPDLGDFE